jgi:deoxycytidine triphosphate deaminase
MILANDEIQALCRAHSSNDLIHPFNKDNVRRSSYDLTVGDEYYIGGEADETSLKTEQLAREQAFTIPPHAICFVLCAESIHLTDELTARVSLRMSLIYKGLVLTTQPPFDPGYKGKVVVMLHNLSSQPHTIREGERLATIEFVRLRHPATHNKPHKSVSTLQGVLSSPISSSLTEISKIAEGTHDRVTWLSQQTLLFAALIVAVLAVPGFYSYSNFSDRLKALEDGKSKTEDERIKELERSMRSLELSKAKS